MRASRAPEIKQLNRVAAARGRKEQTRSSQLPGSHGAMTTAAMRGRSASVQEAPRCRSSKLRKPRIWHEATHQLSNHARCSARRHFARQPKDDGGWRRPPMPFRIQALQLGRQQSQHCPGGTTPQSTTTGEGERKSAWPIMVPQIQSMHQGTASDGLACVRIGSLGLVRTLKAAGLYRHLRCDY